MTAAPRSALAVPGFRAFFVTFMLAMMADNIEHVISYYVAFQRFHSTALAGFAVISHWVPFLVGSVAVGALNDRYDSRRLIQLGMVLFMLVSAGWGYFFVTDSLTIAASCALLVVHGCAGVLWSTSSQMLLYDIVGPETPGQRIRVEGMVTDGTGASVKDVLIEVWQADGQGIYPHSEDPRHAEVARDFRGWARVVLTGAMAAVVVSAIGSFTATTAPGAAPLVLEIITIVQAVLAVGATVLVHRRDANAYFAKPRPR